MAQREVQRNVEGPDATTIGKKTPWSKKRMARRNAELASMAKTRKWLPSMQTVAISNVHIAADHAETPQQPVPLGLSAASPQEPSPSQLSAASPEQPGSSWLSAASLQQPSPSGLSAASPQQPVPLRLSAASPQQPGPSRLSAASPEQPSPSGLFLARSQQPGPSGLSATDPDTPFPMWSESEDDEPHSIGMEDEMLMAPGHISGLSSSSDDAEVNIALWSTAIYNNEQAQNNYMLMCLYV